MWKLRLPLACTVALALAVSGVPLAQDDAAPSGPFPFFYLLHAQVDPAQMSRYGGAIGQILEAHQQHENPNYWATYTPFTTTRGPEFYYFVPMLAMADIDGWTPNIQVMTDSLGAEAAAAAAKALDTSATTQSMVIGYNPGLSNPDTSDESREPPPYLFALRVTVKPGHMGDYIGLVARMKAAHQAHKNGYNWLAYMNLIGGDSRQIHFFIGMDKLAEIDDWMPAPQVLAEQMGTEEAAAVRQAVTEITTSESMILTFAPSFSHAP